MPKRKSKKKSVRSILPADRCPFCKNVTNEYFICDCCGERMFATCTLCRNLGAPSIRAPKRMITVHSRKEGTDGKKKQDTTRMCYPQCARKAAYHCRSCGKWHDRSMLHALCREQNNYNTSLCKGCNELHHQTVCSSCHAICPDDTSRKDSSGVRCDSCFRNRANFTEIQKCGPLGSFRTIIKTPNTTRTFGIELEVNSIHNCDILAKELGQLKIEDVEFEVKRDGSIYTGFEVTTFPADLPTLKKAIEGMCNSIRQYKHNYDNAGLHVHVKDEKVDIVKLFKLWYCVEGFHLACLPNFRRNSQYCYPIVGNERVVYEGSYGLESRRMESPLDNVLDITTVENARSIAAHGRYHTMNLRALDKYGTIEFRAHHATTDYREISHYLTFLDYVYRASFEGFTKERLKELFKLSQECMKRGKMEEFKEVGRAIGLPMYTLSFLATRKDFYDKNEGLNSKTLGVPRRFRFDNGDQPADIRRREQERTVRSPSFRHTRQVNRPSEATERLEIGEDHTIISFSGARIQAAVLAACRQSPRPYCIDSVDPTPSNPNGIVFIVTESPQGGRLWAYRDESEAILASEAIERRIGESARQAAHTFRAVTLNS